MLKIFLETEIHQHSSSQYFDEILRQEDNYSKNMVNFKQNAVKACNSLTNNYHN